MVLCYPIATGSFAQGCIDRRRRLAVVGMKHVAVDRKRDARLGVAEALADRDDIDAISDELRNVAVAQAVERDLGHSDPLSQFAPVG